MKHFGILCPLSALSCELRQRGHRVTMVGLPDVEPYAKAAQIDFYPIGAAKHPLSSMKRSPERHGLDKFSKN